MNLEEKLGELRLFLESLQMQGNDIVGADVFIDMVLKLLKKYPEKVLIVEPILQQMGRIRDMVLYAAKYGSPKRLMNAILQEVALSVTKLMNVLIPLAFQDEDFQWGNWLK